MPKIGENLMFLEAKYSHSYVRADHAPPQVENTHRVNFPVIQVEKSGNVRGCHFGPIFDIGVQS